MLKKIIKTFFRIIGCIVGVVLIFSELPVSNFGINFANDNSHFFREIYAENNDFKDVSLTEISMLGSHDALSNDINFISKSNTNEDNITNNDFVRIIAKGLMLRLAIAQEDDIYTQLKAGVRYVDTRITYIDGEYYNCHGLLSGLFKDNILKILKFLDENPGEFVLMHIVHYYEGESNWTNLKEFIGSVKYNNKSLLDYQNFSDEINNFKDLNYGNLTNNGADAGVVIFSDEETSDPFFNKFGRNIYSDWHNRVSFDLMKEGINNASTRGAELGSDYIRINQAQQTPNSTEPITFVTSWSLLNLAKHHNYKVLKLDNIDTILNNLPIYMCDYSTTNYNNFNADIIEKLKERNINL